MSEAVPEAHLGAPFPACPLCGCEDPRSPEVLLQEHPEVWMRRCSRCSASVADRFPDDDFLAALYDPAHYSSPLTAEQKLTARCAGRILAHFHPDPGADLEVVDYGGNRGSLVRELGEQLRSRGHRGRVRGTVVDLFPETSDEAVRFIDIDTFTAETTRYDLVLASAVLEHLTDMPTVVRRLLGAAQPGALFYARTPFDVPLARLSLGYPVRWPRHLFDLGPDFWANFLDVFGIEGELLVSRPSLVETSFARAPVRTLAAYAMKLPAQLEVAWLGRTSPRWQWIGGWEVLIRLAGRSPA